MSSSNSTFVPSNPKTRRQFADTACGLSGCRHFPQPLGVYRLNAGLCARAEEGFKALVSERDHHRPYSGELRTAIHQSQARIRLGRLLDTGLIENPAFDGLWPMICADTPAGHSTHSASVPKDRRRP